MTVWTAAPDLIILGRRLENWLALHPGPGSFDLSRDFVRSPGERVKLSSAADNRTLR